MFSGNFAQGFITGLADSVNKEIQDDMDMFEKKKSRLGDLALEKSLTEDTRFKQESRDNLKKIQVMASALDTDADTIQFIYDQSGGSLEATAAYVEKLKNAQTAYGGKTIMPINKMLGIEKRTEGKTTALQLANYVTTPKSVYDLSAAGDIRPGFMKFFGSAEGAMSELQSEVSAMEGMAGIGKTSLTDIPSTIEGRGAYDWQLTLTGNPQQDYVMAKQIATKLNNKIAETTDAKQKDSLSGELAMAKSIELMAADKMTLANNFNFQMTTPQALAIRKNSITDLAQSWVVTDPGQYVEGHFISNSKTRDAYDILNSAHDILAEIIDEARVAQVSPNRIATIMGIARRTNKIPVLSKDGVLTIPDDAMELFNANAMSEDGTTPLFLTKSKQIANPPPSTVTGPPNTQKVSASAVSGIIATQNAIDKVVIAARKAKKVDAKTYKSAILDLMDYINPSTGVKYTKAEAEAML